MLNHAIGGINPNAVEWIHPVYGSRGKVVWLPTFESDKHVKTFAIYTDRCPHIGRYADQLVVTNGTVAAGFLGLPVGGWVVKKSDKFRIEGRMRAITRRKVVIGLVAAGCMFAAGGARAGAIIFNGGGTAATSTIALGINDFGHLNTATGNVAVNSGATGLAYKFADGQFRDGISPGAYAEGWGVSTSSSGGHSGYANVATDGVVNLTLGSFVSGASVATSVVSLTTLPGLSVSHVYTPASGAPGALFQSVVTIANTSGTTLNDVKYVRVVDWDVPPTEFNEFVTIHGTATTTLLERSHNGGFSSANPLGPEALFDPGTVNVDFTDIGPADRGAYFRFNFGTLAAGDEIQFSVFYGATASERTALSALAADGIELYSLAQSSPPDGDPTLGTPVTFILGFRDVGSAAQVPTPGTLALLGLGLAGIAFSRRRKLH